MVMPEVSWWMSHGDNESRTAHSLGFDRMPLESFGDSSRLLSADNIFVPDSPMTVKRGHTFSFGNLLANEMMQSADNTGKKIGFVKFMNPVAKFGQVTVNENSTKLVYSAPDESDSPIDIIYYEIVDATGNKDRGYLQIILQDGTEKPSVSWKEMPREHYFSQYWELSFEDAAENDDQQLPTSQPELV
jgi:hypothetical protein